MLNGGISSAEQRTFIRDTQIGCKRMHESHLADFSQMWLIVIFGVEWALDAKENVELKRDGMWLLNTQPLI